MRRIAPYLPVLAFSVVALAFACRPPVAPNGSDAGVPTPCLTDQDCAIALDAGNCNLDAGVCVLCESDTDCGIGTCQAGTCVSDGGITTSSSGSSGSSGSPDSGLPPGQCISSCDCTSAAKPACVSGSCAAKLASCQRSNDCGCKEICSGGSCVPKCASSGVCNNPTPFCYLPQGQCGPCTNSQQCGAGGTCQGGTCQGGGANCNPTHCCSNGDCLRTSPVCNVDAGSCGPCVSSLQCSQGYTCTNGQCELADGGGGGACPNGCTGGLVCVSGQCQSTNCNPPCGPPATCGANNSCVCPANCGGICPQGQTCDTTRCQCTSATGGSSGLSSSGLGGSGFPGLGDGGFGLPGACSGSTCNPSSCGGCPSGQSCNCPLEGSGCSAPLGCLLEGFVGMTGCCQ